MQKDISIAFTLIKAQDVFKRLLDIHNVRKSLVTQI